MIKHASLFSQLIDVFDRNKFKKIVNKHGSEKHSKGFDSWDHYVSMLFCQLAGAQSLREITKGLSCTLGKLKHLGMKGAPKRSTLSYANKNRSSEVYKDMFYETLGLCQSSVPKKGKFKFKNKLLSFDSSLISLSLSLFPWAEYRQKKGAIKLHLLLDHEGYIPVFANITDGKTHDSNIGWDIPVMKDSIIVVDRAYVDFDLLYHWNLNDAYFVSRQKTNAAFRIIEEKEVPQKSNILNDQIIELTGYNTKKKYPLKLRRVVVWDSIKEKELVFITNNFKFGATTISEIYKDRWEIEVFFKTLKQNLKIKTFVGTSENAINIQIWTALISILLIKYLKFRSSFGWSISNLVALLRWNLFTYRDLWEWIDDPFKDCRQQAESVQQTFEFPYFRQQA
jgi:hypothetical protein